MGKLRDLIYSKWANVPNEDDYMKMYEANLATGMAHRAAWEATEAQWLEMTGKNKYKTFNSFQGVKSRKNNPMSNTRHVRSEFDSKYNFLV